MNRILSLSAKAMLAAASIAASAGSASAQETERGWFKACATQGKNTICNVQFELMADTGQLVTAANIIEIKGELNRRVLQIAVPSGRLIPPGVSMAIDGGAARKIDYLLCLPDRCIAEAPVDDALISSLKGGSDLTLTSINFQRAPNPIKITLSGFTSAFDGEAMAESELEERQKVLEAEMKKKAEESRQKLDAAQDEAKKAN